MPGHDGRIAQGLADGHVAVTGHYCEQKDLNTSKKMGNRELSQAALIRNGYNDLLSSYKESAVSLVVTYEE